MDDEKLRHLLALRKATQIRIRVLEQRKAERGDLDTGQSIELQQAQEDIHILDAKLSSSGPSAQVSELVPDAQILLLDHKLKRFSERWDDGMTFIMHHFAQEAEARAAGQQRTAQEQRRIWISVGLLALAVLVLTLLVVRWFV